MLASYSNYNKLQRLKITELCSSTILDARSPKLVSLDQNQGVSRSMPSLEVVGENLFLVSSGLWLLLFNCSAVSDSLRPHGLQHTRLLCPSLSPGVCSDSCPLSRWCHSTISSPVALFSSCPPSFPASGSFPVSLLFTSGGKIIGVSATASVLPMNIQCWFPLGLAGLISLLSKGLIRVFFSSAIWKFMGMAGISSPVTSPFLHHLLVAFSCLCQVSFFLPLMTQMIASRVHLDNPR